MIIGLPFLPKYPKKAGKAPFFAREAFIREAPPTTIRYVHIQSPRAIMLIIGEAKDPNRGAMIDITE